MHVSYRRAVRLFVGVVRRRVACKSCRHGRCFVTLPLILLACQHPNKVLHRYLPCEIDLEIAVSAESLDPTWERFGSPRDPPRDPQETLREPQETLRNDHETLRNPQQTTRDPQEPSTTPQGPTGNPSGNLRNLTGNLRDLPEDATGSDTYIQ